MWKLLLVDDESVTRRGLRGGIPWEELGIGEVFEARDGVDGLKIATQHRPDILVTDVRMPRLNGVELAMEVRKILPETKLIFISGYSDKEYLMAAIRLGAIGYVEKPIDLGEIIEAIRQAVELCAGPSIGEGQDFLPLVRQDMIYRLIKPGADVLNLQRGLTLVGLRLGLNAWYVAMIVKLDGGADLVRCWLARLEKVLPGAVLCEKEGHIVALLQVEDQQGAMAARDEALVQLRAQSDAHLAFAALGTPVSGMVQIHASYEQAAVALQSLFFLGFGRVALYRQHEATERPGDNPEESFLQLLAMERYDELEEAVRRLCEALSQEPHMLVSHVKRLFMRMFLALQQEAQRRHIALEAQGAEAEECMWSAISDCATLDQLKTLLLSKIRAFTEEVLDAQSVNHKVAAALRLIEEQYMNADMCVVSLADQVHLSQTYLSALFKRTIGHSISEHLLNLRVEKSKRLLIEGDIRLGEIAGLVGYNDANAFAKAFKRATGLSPAKFRQKYQR